MLAYYRVRSAFEPSQALLSTLIYQDQVRSPTTWRGHRTRSKALKAGLVFSISLYCRVPDQNLSVLKRVLSLLVY